MNNYDISEIYKKNIEDIIRYMEKGEVDIKNLHEYVRVTTVKDTDT